jgi:antitoxin component YwqK of YwqJK toxin-antitoxin module
MSKKVHTIQSSDKKEFDEKVNFYLDLGFELHDNGYQVINKDNHTFHSQVLIIDTDNHLIDFHHNGQIEYICRLNKNGYKDGKYYEWDENGKEKHYVFYSDGVEKFESYTNEDIIVETEFFDNGQEKEKNSYDSYKDLHGCCTEWYENGNKKVEGNYRNDIRHGKWTYWGKDGRKESEDLFDNGEITLQKIFMEDGTMKERTSRGNRVYFKHYKDSHPFKEEIYKSGDLISVKELNKDGSIKEEKKY